MLRNAFVVLFFFLPLSIWGMTTVRGFEAVNGKLFASSNYRLFVVAMEGELPIRSVEVRIDNGDWTLYADSQLDSWCEGAGCKKGFSSRLQSSKTPPSPPNLPMKKAEKDVPPSDTTSNPKKNGSPSQNQAATKQSSEEPPISSRTDAVNRDSTRRDDQVMFRGVRSRGTFAIAGEGMHTITTRATDLLGNRSVASRQVVYIDNTSPGNELQAYFFVDPGFDTTDIDPRGEDFISTAKPAHTENNYIYVGPRYALHLDSTDQSSGVRGIRYRLSSDQPWLGLHRVSQDAGKSSTKSSANVFSTCAKDGTMGNVKRIETSEEDSLASLSTVLSDKNELKMNPGWNILEVQIQDVVYNCSDVLAFPIYYDTHNPTAKIQPEIEFPVVPSRAMGKGPKKDLNPENRRPVATVLNRFIVSTKDIGSGIGDIQVRYQHDLEYESLGDPAKEVPDYEFGSEGEEPEGWSRYIRPLQFSQEGWYRIWVRAVDHVGNVGKPYHFDVQIVIRPPGTDLRGVK